MVTRLSSQTQCIAEYIWKFPHPRNRPLASVLVDNMPLDVRVSGGLFDAEYVGVFDQDRLVGMINVWAPEDPLPYCHIGKSIVDTDYQGHGITRQLIEWWVSSRNRPLASDENQTHDGARVWESMIMREPRLTFFLWSEDSLEQPLKVHRGRITPDPWAAQHTRILAQPTIIR